MAGNRIQPSCVPLAPAEDISISNKQCPPHLIRYSADIFTIYFYIKIELMCKIVIETTDTSKTEHAKCKLFLKINNKVMRVKLYSRRSVTEFKI